MRMNIEYRDSRWPGPRSYVYIYVNAYISSFSIPFGEEKGTEEGSTSTRIVKYTRDRMLVQRHALMLPQLYMSIGLFMPNI